MSAFQAPEAFGEPVKPSIEVLPSMASSRLVAGRAECHSRVCVSVGAGLPVMQSGNFAPLQPTSIKADAVNTRYGLNPLWRSSDANRMPVFYLHDRSLAPLRLLGRDSSHLLLNPQVGSPGETLTCFGPQGHQSTRGGRVLRPAVWLPNDPSAGPGINTVLSLRANSYHPNHHRAHD